jgi:hypothetical protein
MSKNNPICRKNKLFQKQAKVVEEINSHSASICFQDPCFSSWLSLCILNKNNQKQRKNMSQNISVSLFGDNDHLVVYIAIISPEFLGLVLLALGISGLYNGTEIGHPVYSLIFANVMFPFFVTVINILSISFLPLQSWLRLAPSLNYLCLMFHSTTW